MVFYTENIVLESLDEPQNCVIDLNELTIKISRSVLSRQFLEMRHRTVEDDGLVGLLNLLTNLLKHRPPFQTSKQGQDLLCEVKTNYIGLCVFGFIFF